MSYALGVDLGTTFTRAAICRPGEAPFTATVYGHQLLPATVHSDPDGTLTLGGSPPQGAGPAPEQVFAGVRLRLGDSTPIFLGGRSSSPSDLLSSVLNDVIDQVARAQTAAADRVVATYPASWGTYRQGQFASVLEQVNLPLAAVTMLAEPVAAVRQYCGTRPVANDDLLAVYDLGGKTFDACVIQPGDGVLGVPETLAWVGGSTLDEAVLGYVDQASQGAVSALDPADPLQARALAQIVQECARGKERLSRKDAVTLSVIAPGRKQRVTLTRLDFETLIRPAITSSIQALSRTMASAGVSPQDLSGVLLIGGCSQIPLVRHLVEQELGCVALFGSSAQHAVALGGAAFGAEHLADLSPVEQPPPALLVPVAPEWASEPDRTRLAPPLLDLLSLDHPVLAPEQPDRVGAEPVRAGPVGSTSGSWAGVLAAALTLAVAAGGLSFWMTQLLWPQ